MKIFFSDMDGTLLNSQKEITPKTKAALDAFTDAGNTFVISTGRPIFSARYIRDYHGLNYPGSYISAYNGSMLYDNTNHTVLYEDGIAVDLIPELLDLAERFGVYIQGYQGDYVISRVASEEFEYYKKSLHMDGLVDKDFMPLIHGPSPKMIAIALQEHERLDALAKAIDESLGDVISTARSADRHLEIYPATGNKGNALIRLCEILHIPIEDSLAAGDEENDIPMLRAAGCGIAMANARPSVQAAADTITEKDNDHDGLVPYLLHP